MDENGEVVLNNYCVFEIIDYIIANCKAIPKKVEDRSIDYDDLINFVLANEFFMGLLEERHKSLYDDLEMALVCRIQKLLIDLRINKQSEAETEFFWKSYIQSVNERSPFNVELSFGHAFVNIDIKCKSPGFKKTEKLRLDEKLTSQTLVDILHTNQNLTMLTLESAEVHGSIYDIIPHCSNLEVLSVKLNVGDILGQYAPLAKLPNLTTVIFTGLFESGLESIFFNDLTNWNRPKSMKPMTLTIKDELTKLNWPVSIATLYSLRNLHAYNYCDDNFIFIEAQYELPEMPEDSDSIQESLATITLGKNVTIKFDRNNRKLELKLHPESDLSQLDDLSKLRNLSRLVIQNKCRSTEYPESLAKFLRIMATKKNLKSCQINYGTIDEIECTELAKMESLQYLGCHLSKWSLIKTLSQLPNLQHAVINVREPVSSDISMMVFNFLALCQVQASVCCSDFHTTLNKNEKLLQITGKMVNIPMSLAQLDGVKTLQIVGDVNIVYINSLLKTFMGNICKIEEFDFSEMQSMADEPICFKDISNVAEIQSTRKLKLYISNTTGIEKLAALNNLEELEIYEYADGNLSGLFTKLAEKNIIRFISCGNLGTEEVLSVSRIRSLKKLVCHISDPEDLNSLSELADSSIEELIFTEPQSSHSLQKVFAAFSSNCKTTLQHLNVDNLDITGNCELTKIEGLKRSFEPSYYGNEHDFFKKSWNVVELNLVLTLQKLEICNEIGFSVCKYLVELERLESLKCSLVNEQGIEVLAHIKNLKELIICESKGSLTEVFREFVHNNESKLRELHTPIICSDEITEISKMKSLITLNIEFKNTFANFSNLKQLDELESLHISQHFNCKFEPNYVLPIIQACQQLACVTLQFNSNGKVDTNFVSEINTILKSVRDPTTQRPLKLSLTETSIFPEFYIEAIDEAYLTVFHSYQREWYGYEIDFVSDCPESDGSEFFDYP